MQWQSIVFDMDDTLYPERDFVLSGYRAAASWAEQRLGIPAAQGYDELRSLYESGVRGDTFNRWLSRYPVDVEACVRQLIEVYRDHTPDIRPFDGIEALLRTLAQDARLGLISDGYLAVQRRKLDALRLEGYFASVIFSDVWGREHWKPSEKPYREAQAQLGSSPRLTVYVGDNPRKDFYGARRCGWHTVWWKRPHGEYAHLLPPSDEYAAHKVVSTASELLAYLCEVSTVAAADREAS